MLKKTNAQHGFGKKLAEKCFISFYFAILLQFWQTDQNLAAKNSIGHWNINLTLVWADGFQIPVLRQALNVSCHFMRTILHIILPLTVLSFPFIFFFTYLKIIERRVQNVVAKLPTNTDGQFLNVTVWFKDFNLSEKRKNFSIDPIKTLYSFNIADLYVLKDAIIVIGKTKILGKTRLLTPFIICRNNKADEYKYEPV